jgi:hypothetical protein
VALARRAKLTLGESFSVDGTLIAAWALQKSVRRKDGNDDNPDGVCRNAGRNFHGEKRRNTMHASRTDPEALLASKSDGMAARPSYVGDTLMENRNGGSAIDGRTIRHPGYVISQRIHKRIEEPFGGAKQIGGLRQTKQRGLARVRQEFLKVMAAFNLVRIRHLLSEVAWQTVTRSIRCEMIVPSRSDTEYLARSGRFLSLASQWRHELRPNRKSSNKQNAGSARE